MTLYVFLFSIDFVLRLYTNSCSPSCTAVYRAAVNRKSLNLGNKQDCQTGSWKWFINSSVSLIYNTKNIYRFKVIHRNTRKRNELCIKLTKTLVSST